MDSKVEHSDQNVPFGPAKTNLLTEDQAVRSVVVLNISRFAVEDADDIRAEVVRYFEQERNGGGKIDSVQFPDGELAIITFDSKEGW